MIYNHLKRTIFIICSLFFGTFSSAQGLNPLFVEIDTGKCYRIVNAEYDEGGIAIGSLHDSEIIVKYISGTQAPTEDCYWYIERNSNGIRFRNKKTGEYLTYTAEKDYTTFVNLKLQSTPSAQSDWILGVHNGYLNFHHRADVNYYISVEKSTGMVQSSKGSPENSTKYFTIIDEDGKSVKIPATTPFSAHINNLAFDGQKPIFESRKAQFMYPLPTEYLDGGTYTPEVTFDTADSAEYRLVTEGANSLTFNNAATAESFTIQLLRDGTKVAESAIVFSPLPIVEITTTLPDDKIKEYRSGTIRVLNQSTPDSAGVEQELPAFFRYRGATTLNYPKRSFNIKLRDEAGEDLDTTFFNIRSKDKWIMDAMSIDQIKMRNRVCFDIWNDYSKLPYNTEFNGRNGTDGEFVEVVLNGAYNGIYCFTDRIDRKLLDLKKYKQDIDGNTTIRGVLYKSNLWDNTGLTNAQRNPDARMDSTEWNNWELQYPDDFPGEATWTPLLNLYNSCSGNSLAMNPTFYFYEDNLIDFHILVMTLNLIDNGNKNVFLSNKNITKENPFVFTPWDMDTSLGGYYDGRYYGGTYDVTPVADLRIHKNEPFATMWGHNINKYRKKLATRWEELKKGALCADSVQARLTNYAELFTKCKAWEREYSRWQKEEKYGCPTAENLKSEVEQIMEWYKERLDKVDEFIKESTTNIDILEDIEEAEGPAYHINGTTADEEEEGIIGILIRNGKKYFINR